MVLRKSLVVSVLALPVVASVPLVVTRAETERRTRRQRLLTIGGTFTFLLVAGGLFWALQLWNYVV